MMNNKEHTNWFLNRAKENFLYTEREVKLIDAIQKSDISDSEKVTFGLLLMNYGIEQLRVRNLEDRLLLSYTGENLDNYLNKIIQFNPKLGYVSLEAGESHRDEKDDSSLYFSIPVKYSEDIDEYFESASKIKEELKRVLRIILIDAEKMGVLKYK